MNILYKMRKQLKGSDWPWRSAVVCMWCVVLWCAEPEAAPETVSGCCKLHRSGKHGNCEQYLILIKLVHH